MAEPLTDIEKSYFDTILQGAPIKDLTLRRMVLDGKDVAVVSRKVRNRFTGKHEGLMPLALLLDDDTISRLRDLDGTGPSIASPFDLE